MKIIKGIKLNKIDFEIIKSVMTKWSNIYLNKVKPKVDDFDTCFFIENHKVIYLSLNGYTLNKFPNRIFELVNLKELKLVSNEYTFIPESIDKLKNLELLNLRINELKALPRNLKNLKQLKYLDISHNHFKYLPEEICYLKNLEYLNIQSTSIEELPSNIDKLINLKELHIDDTHIKKLPKTLLSLKNLRKIVAYMWGEEEDEVYQILKKRNVKLSGFRLKKVS